MSKATFALDDLAMHLISLETKSNEEAHPHLEVALRVCERLRLPFSRLVGANGFSSFFSRSLALSKSEVPALQMIQFQRDGKLTLNCSISTERDTSGDSHAAKVLVTNLLKLMVTFIGELLTVTLIQEAWPDQSLIGLTSDLRKKP